MSLFQDFIGLKNGETEVGAFKNGEMELIDQVLIINTSLNLRKRKISKKTKQRVVQLTNVLR